MSLRLRLAATTTVWFLVVGVVLLAIEYVVLTTVIEQSIGSSSGGSSASPANQRAVSAVLSVATELQGIVMIISAGAVILLALVAGALTWRTVARSLARVGEVTALAEDLSARNLSSRIRLNGPDDEIKALADTLDTMLARLEVAFEAQERFISAASHELRTPLTAIRAALEPSLIRGRFGEDVAPAVERTMHAVVRAEQLVTSLLQLARTTAPIHHQRHPIRLDDIVEALEHDAQQRASEAGIALNAAAAPATVIGDQVLLTQLTSNLIDNALKYTLPGGEITIESHTRDASAFLTVTNSPVREIASPPKQLFEPFHRGAYTRTEGDPSAGTGLGLAIVKAIAIQHGGHARIDYTEGDIFTVTVTIPEGSEALENAEEAGIVSTPASP